MQEQNESTVSTGAHGAGAGARVARRIRRARRSLGRSLFRAFGPAGMRRLMRTWRYEFFHPEQRAAAEAGGGGFIMALWHGRMLPSIPPYAGQDFAILVSASADGDLSEGLLRSFGYDIIRGSSSRGGARALREMLAALDRGSIVAITPDGPRGPRHSMNPGLAWMARATGFPVLPTGFASERMWHARSWDRYNIPKPRARIAVAYGEPVRVAHDASADEMHAATEDIRKRLLEVEREAFAHFGQEPDF